jgi:15-cis-phytoene synthase
MSGKAINPADLAACREAIRTGSYSFHAASRLLPAKVRDPSLALYAFCRLADDAVDEGDDKVGAVLSLRDRLDLVYAGRPKNAAADRAFAAVVAQHNMPRALPDALLEGFAWDAGARTYDDFSALCGYGARVASSVGAMMCVLMGVRGADALARACDLGLAMQLTNIARDIGTDARQGRLYIPRAWLDEFGLRPDCLARAAQNPAAPPDARIALISNRLLAEARDLYIRAEAGIPALPLAARPAIFAARHIYDAIGRDVRRLGPASLHQRAHTTARQKLGWLALANMRAAFSVILPRPALLHARAHPQCAFLVDAAAGPNSRAHRSDALFAALAQLEAKDRGLPLGSGGGFA